MPRLSDAQLAEIRERCERMAKRYVEHANGAECETWHMEVSGSLCSHCQLMEHAHADIPALLSHIDELAAERERLWTALLMIDDYDGPDCNCPPEACGCEKADLQRIARTALAAPEDKA